MQSLLAMVFVTLLHKLDKQAAVLYEMVWLLLSLSLACLAELQHCIVVWRFPFSSIVSIVLVRQNQLQLE